MAKLSIEWLKLKKGFYSYVTSPASNGAYAMSFLTIFATIPFLALLVYAATLIAPLYYLESTVEIFIFQDFTPSTEEDLTPIIEGFLSNAKELGFIGALFGLYSAYLFFSSLDFWIQTIYGERHRSDIGVFFTTLWFIFLVTIAQSIFTILKSFFEDWRLIVEIFNMLSLWLSIFIAYIVLPNATVNKKNALTIAFIISLVVVATKIGFVYYVYYAFSYKTIYGSFATVMFLLIWIEICWWIFFSGLNALKVHKNS